MKGLRILLIEDDASLGTLLAETLVDMGHVICGIETTEAGAVEAALRDRPELMIVDMRLRKGSGVAAVAAILRITSIPHIFMSGERLPTGGAPAVELRKPFTHRDLVDSIERVTDAIRGVTLT